LRTSEVVILRSVSDEDPFHCGELLLGVEGSFAPLRVAQDERARCIVSLRTIA
jgi:hypothetical protein